MPYFNIYYNADSEPYIIQKNYGHNPDREGSSSHWTWHITPRGVTYLCTDHEGRTRPMPGYINDDEFEDLKSYRMLRKVSGETIGRTGLYPSDDPNWRKTLDSPRPTAAKPAAYPRITERPHVGPPPAPRKSPPARPVKAEKKAEKKEKGFWASLLAAFRGE
jgi:hypothetical protein